MSIFDVSIKDIVDGINKRWDEKQEDKRKDAEYTRKLKEEEYKSKMAEIERKREIRMDHLNQCEHEWVEVARGTEKEEGWHHTERGRTVPNSDYSRFIMLKVEKCTICDMEKGYRKYKDKEEVLDTLDPKYTRQLIAKLKDGMVLEDNGEYI